MSSSPSDLADRQHGMAPSPEARLVAIAHPRDDIEAQLITNLLADAGIDFAAVTKELEDEGVASFQNAYVGMLEAIQKRHDTVS